MNANHENISLLLLSRNFFFFFVVRIACVFLNVGALRFLFLPRPFNTLPIKFCADSDMRLDTISTGLTSGDVLSAKSDIILPPVRMVSRPSDWALLQRIGLIHRQNPVNTLPIP
jgi:hypothetical protein